MRPSERTSWRILEALSPPILVLLVWATLKPGISGTFLFDDLVNLPALSASVPSSWDYFLNVIAAGQAGPTGRPFALASFLINKHAWPSTAEPFLWTNLLIHGTTAVLLLGLSRLLYMAHAPNDNRRATIFGILVSLLWALHPLQISTVFYVIQRMTELSALFSIAALYAYVAGRQSVAHGGAIRGCALIATAPVLATIGFYAKENAALVPLALLLLEYWFFRNAENRFRGLQVLRVGMLWLPVLGLTLFLAVSFGSDGYASRNFTAVERMLTEPRILLDYLHLLLVPVQISTGLFNDNFPISRGLFEPWTTVPAILACVFLVGGAIAFRQRCPLASWGIAFFFAMHALESTTVPLELYFEHRNYLPSVGIAFAVSIAGMALYDYRRYLGVAFLTAVLVGVGLIGHLRAENWGAPLRQAEIWARETPSSPRVWQNLALRNFEHDLDGGVRYALERWQKLQPDNVLPEVSLLTYECPSEPLELDRLRHLSEAMSTGPYEHGLLGGLRRLTDQTVSGNCRGLRPDQVHVLIRSLLENPAVNNKFVRQRLWDLDGHLLLAPEFIADAMAAFGKSHRWLFDLPMLLVQARALANRGYTTQALRLLKRHGSSTKPSVYGPLHLYPLLRDENTISKLAANIREESAPKWANSSPTTMP